MYHETHIFMFGLIHLQADRRTNGQTGGYIFCRCIDLVQSFNYLHESAFCAPNLQRLFQNYMIILVSYLRARRFQWFKMNGFSW